MIIIDKNNIIVILVFLGLTFLITQFGFSQDVLDNYIKAGLENNISLKQKQISLEKANYSLKTASSYFYPSVSFQGNYTTGDGGRNIAIPVGDLVNPVNRTLNQLTGTNSFPQIDNVKENLFPKNFYDFKIRTSVPLLNTDLIYNKKINSDQVQLNTLDIEIYKMELIKEIKIAYYNYLSTLEAVKIYNSTLSLANESKRVQELLIKNGKGLNAYLLRSESEIENVKSLIMETENKCDLAKQYFNYLLNKDLKSEIITNIQVDSLLSSAERLNGFGYDIKEKEEIKMLSKLIDINKKVLDNNNLTWVPKVSAFLDLGAQDKLFKYNGDSKYYLFGIQLDLPLFEASRNKFKINVSEMEINNTKLQLEKTYSQLKMSLSNSKNDFELDRKNYGNSLDNLNYAQSYYNIIEKGYAEGIYSFIETLDSRNQLMNSQIRVNLNKYKVLISSAKLERELAINKNK